MTWLRDVGAALQKAVLMEERMSTMSERLTRLVRLYEDLDRRLARIEGKFELLERMGAPRGWRLPHSHELDHTMTPTEGKTVILGLTGASGAILAQAALRMLERDPRVARVHLV